ncbi:MAG: VOC family protein [Alphaproteobacteria bacterium]|nr:VOC family protein [Alphaproteobacteria bacterium]MBU0798935.1 VOC family protein [Alphaproteobacteria bacterium]MBU0886323.1 VOC family protein [Alphaproteobacteria bacterium]MBU1813481.1 VOC family protein [Alphaproteobacteria bacterium]
MEQRVSLITLGVADVARSRAFYEALGWTASTLGDGSVAFFQCGGMILSLFARADLAGDAGLPAEGDGFRATALAYNTRSHDEVDTVLADMIAAGATLVKPAQEAFWGGYAGYAADLDGHLWEIAWNPGFAIAEDGSVQLPE